MGLSKEQLKEAKKILKEWRRPPRREPQNPPRRERPDELVTGGRTLRRAWQ